MWQICKCWSWKSLQHLQCQHNLKCRHIFKHFSLIHFVYLSSNLCMHTHKCIGFYTLCAGYIITIIFNCFIQICKIQWHFARQRKFSFSFSIKNVILLFESTVWKYGYGNLLAKPKLQAGDSRVWLISRCAIIFMQVWV